MKKILILLGLALLGIAIYVVLNSRAVDRIQYLSTLFTGAEQYENFNRVKDIFPTATLRAPEQPFEFADGETIRLPEKYVFDGREMSLATFLSETDTAALLVLVDGGMSAANRW